ncbi:MAG TPA: 50S ribosomal protein L16 [Saprospiraceae bacterium]|jgi:large subunit ribosomal protein L16|nr:50S ribosomal protein L16 [Saprospiraceae bacterium]MBK6665087.1 50S ribosomal protein L16 [Saprospiraceae bacterium]MBK7699053.1 50S ribosomal protein L16 [Saprospiraceae bacterium]MBK8826743.1 50S ribosomal protein L16 [Saprospiraceae bacterium]MBK8886673.1 50S ribosomal protein L16 [Saprospiraceae bacterium]
MLQPKRTKYRKQHKMKTKGIAVKGGTISFGSFALKSLEIGRITNRQLESARIAMTRYMKREGKVWIRIFPDKPITKKPQEVRMGKGKGALDHWVAVVKPGKIMFELDGVPSAIAVEALRLAAQKLPVLTKTVIRADFSE